jgi:hypothetical protein
LSISKVEHLSGVWAAVIRDVKMLRQKFRQEVDRVYDQLKEIEKNQTCEKEASNRVKGEQLHLELLGSQLKNNTGEHILLGQVLQAGRV